MGSPAVKAEVMSASYSVHLLAHKIWKIRDTVSFPTTGLYVSRSSRSGSARLYCPSCFRHPPRAADHEHQLSLACVRFLWVATFVRQRPSGAHGT
eukprot:822862-Pyramimonas_sp.AAC.1